MRVAFYKGTRHGFVGLFNTITRWWLNGVYSHCELIFSDGVSASASFTDGGVRFKTIDFNPAKWDIVEVQASEVVAREWFKVNEGAKYDVWGLFGFIARRIKGQQGRFFCSESIMEALGYSDSWRFDPCNMASCLGVTQPSLASI